MFLTIGISLISGIVGGLVVVWLFQGVHFLDKGIRFDNKNPAERYFWKYSFLLAILIVAVFIISLFAFLFNKLGGVLSFIIISEIFIASLIWIILTISVKLR